MEDSDYTRIHPDANVVNSFRKLLTTQEYVDDVRLFHGQEVGVDLNAFRLRMRENHRRETLVQMQLRSHGVPETELDKPWIKVVPRKEMPVIVNLTERYRNRDFSWYDVAFKYKGKIGFVGSKREHELFCSTYGDVPHIVTENLYELAAVIAGSELFVGNQSLPLALAHAMHHPTACEMSRTGIDGWHRKINCVGTAGSTITLPDLCRPKLLSAATSRLRFALETGLTWVRAVTQ